MGEAVDVSITYKGREVQNPVLRTLLGAFAILTGFVAICWTVIVVALLCVMSPLLIVIHFALKATDRRGFIAYTPNGGIGIDVSGSGFRKIQR